jgi:hypothetical protein
MPAIFESPLRQAMAKTRELTFTLAVLLKCNAAFLRPSNFGIDRNPANLLIWSGFGSEVRMTNSRR